MPKFKSYRKDQVMLFPKTIDEYVPQNHLARLVHHIVEERDTSSIEDT
jgi:transposase